MTPRFGWRSKLLLLCLGVLVAAGCTDAALEPTLPPTSHSENHGGDVFAFDPPSELIKDKQALHHAALKASLYSTDLPNQRVNAVSDSLTFMPGSGAGMEDLAFACYQFSRPLSSKGMIVEFDWESEPTVAAAKSQMWIGLADWQADRWRFMKPATPSSLTVEEVAPYLPSATSHLITMVVVIAAGDKDPILSTIHAATLDYAPIISVVSPLDLPAHTPETFSAVVDAWPLATLSWAFGAEASPEVSTLHEPQVRFLRQGVHYCSVTATNSAGSITKSFAVVAGASPPGYSSTLVLAEEQGVIKAAVHGPAGELYLAETLLSGSKDFYITKLDQLGQLVWCRRLQYRHEGGETGNILAGLACDPAGDLLMAFDYGWLGGGIGGIVAKLSASGSLLWAQRWDGPEYEDFTGIATDAAGNVLVSGRTWLPDTDPEEPTGQDGFALKYSFAGTLQWAKGYSASAVEHPTSCVIDQAGTNWLMGDLTEAGVKRRFLLSLDATGTIGGQQRINAVNTVMGAVGEAGVLVHGTNGTHSVIARMADAGAVPLWQRELVKDGEPFDIGADSMERIAGGYVSLFDGRFVVTLDEAGTVLGALRAEQELLGGYSDPRLRMTHFLYYSDSDYFIEWDSHDVTSQAAAEPLEFTALGGVLEDIAGSQGAAELEKEIIFAIDRSGDDAVIMQMVPPLP